MERVIADTNTVMAIFWREVAKMKVARLYLLLHKESSPTIAQAMNFAELVIGLDCLEVKQHGQHQEHKVSDPR